ncbi:MAG TPA: tripartite tricarboxylate transporter substrate binding protein [Xanthobacteraceae bacterium]|jgi:tripartite-type tricarboxylate transporter receptor subunit TctC|nr:tripartite tricarboxylate transporter substrate binding protein [Xanthobacteraceae bacterium]
MFNPTRFALRILAAIATVGAASAQNWPTRPVTMIVPFAAGSSTDTAGRVLAVGLSEVLGQQVIIENVGGGGGMTGTARVAKAPPDGYQFVFASVDSMAIVPAMHKAPLYNSVADFTPAGLVVEQPIVLITRTDLPVNTLREFVAYAKANHARMQFGSSGVGSGSHFSCAKLNAALGIEPTHVPYRGSGLAMQDLIGGRIDYFCALGAAAMGPLEAGNAKAIALLTSERSDLFPALRTLKEQGIPGVDSSFWTASFFPKDTPDAVVQKLYDATTHALNSPVTIERLKKAGVAPIAPELRTPAYLKTFIGREVDNWAAMIKASGVPIE